MDEMTDPEIVGRASSRRRSRFSFVWLIPLVAVGIGAWLAWTTVSSQGPLIEVSFESGEGLQAGQSQLKYREITFGTVQSLTLTPDHKHVNVRIQTTAAAVPLLTDSTIFWVVKPRLFAGNISGLDTILSGSYVGFVPGAEGGKPKREFIGREDPPVLSASVPGTTYVLNARRLGSISVGSPIFFRDFNVGEVLGWDIQDMADSVGIHAFVRAPFDKYVLEDSRFWNDSGIDVTLSGTGVKVQLASVKALLLGGVAFDTPPAGPDGKPSAIAAAEHSFPLFSDRQSAVNASYTRQIPLVAYFPGSVRGLEAGADVTIQGLTVGHVTAVRLSYDREKDTILAPVRFEVEPERIVGIGGKQIFKTSQEAMDTMVQRGLRASLQSTSLITGGKMVALEFVADAPPAKVTMDGRDFVIPTTGGGGLADLQSSATALLDQVNTIPFAAIGNHLNGILKSVDQVTGGPELKQTITQLSGTIATIQDVVRRLDAGISPTLKQLPGVTSELGRTIGNADKLVQSLQGGYGDNTQFNRDLERALGQLNEALRSVRSLADLLTRHPEALIKGRPAGGIE